MQVPLLATSVANWLEPGFLGDVLQRMSGAFVFAAEKAPAILFIDEIDNIGSRHASGASRNYDDYWTSMINRMLELLDGASRREGVIVVGATNLPERIDPAPLRSGRLETHIPISLPDVDALVGILASHLGPDLEPVLASAPPPGIATPLRPPPAINNQPLRRGRPSTLPDTNRNTPSAQTAKRAATRRPRKDPAMKTGEHPQSLDDLRPLARLALGRSGADIERLVREVRRSLRRTGKHVAWSDIETALRQDSPACPTTLPGASVFTRRPCPRLYTDGHCRG